MFLATAILFGPSPTGPRSTLAPGQIPSPRGKKAVQMPHPLLLKYLSSKTNFVFNQTLFTLVKERCAVMTPSNFIKRPLSPLSTNKGEILPWKSVKPCKNPKTHGHITVELDINLVQIPHPSMATMHGHDVQSNARAGC